MTSIIRLYDKPPTFDNVLVSQVNHALHTERIGQLVLFTGKPGAGKTYCGARLCKAVDPTFNASRVVFTARGFLDLIRDGNLPPGSAILFDEAGREAGSRTFMSRDQTALMVFIQGMRKLQYLVVFTVPARYMVDSQLRSLAHILCEYVTKSPGNYVTFKVKFNQFRTMQKSGDTIYTFPVVKYKGRQLRVTSIKFTMPDKEWRMEYEKMKDAYLETLASAIVVKEKQMNVAGAKTQDVNELLKPYLAEAMKTPEAFNNRFNRPDYVKLKVRFPELSQPKAKVLATLILNQTKPALQSSVYINKPTKKPPFLQ